MEADLNTLERWAYTREQHEQLSKGLLFQKNIDGVWYICIPVVLTIDNFIAATKNNVSPSEILAEAKDNPDAFYEYIATAHPDYKDLPIDYIIKALY